MYKVIFNGKVIDVLRYPTYVKFLKFGQVTTTGQTSAQGVAGSDGDTLFGLTPEALKIRPTLKLVTIQEITEVEYDRLKALLDEGQTVSADTTELARAKANKIASLSSLCKTKIIAGITLELSDGEKHDFKLTTEDQLNLMRLEAQLHDAANDIFVYHATNQPCQVFSRSDMHRIVNAAQQHMTYHTTYFNVAKQYINSLLDTEAVRLFKYGTDISFFAENPVIQQILKRGEQRP